MKIKCRGFAGALEFRSLGSPGRGFHSSRALGTAHFHKSANPALTHLYRFISQAAGLPRKASATAWGAAPLKALAAQVPASRALRARLAGIGADKTLRGAAPHAVAEALRGHPTAWLRPFLGRRFWTPHGAVTTFLRIVCARSVPRTSVGESARPPYP